MTHAADPPGDAPESDLEYDLAHEDGTDAHFAQPSAAPTVQVATQTTTYDGDYGYDLAHDVPRH